MLKKLGIGWEIGLPSGWGVYGLNLSMQLARRKISPVPLMIAEDIMINPLQKRLLRGAFKNHAIEAKFARLHGKVKLPYPILHSMGNDLGLGDVSENFHGSPDIGVVFFETVSFSKEKVRKAKELALIITGSTWNTEILREHGIDNVSFCPQGVDLSLFHPAPKTDLMPDRFVVFSGGKLEYRKGQDIVVAAFKIFHSRHPEALLMTAWSNRWPESMKLLELSSHVKGIPVVRSDRSLDIPSWLKANGLPDNSFVDLGEVSNIFMPQLLREADVALFTNRCEGGTNLVAMECMACCLPTILSKNTGHFDLIETSEGKEKNCYALNEQQCIGEKLKIPDFSGWGESSVEEAVEKLEKVYSNRQEAKKRGNAAAEFMKKWSWEKQIDRLVEAVEAIAI
ncbi:MAG: glycosyltransferase family 4 protein [Alphaproteobacteria bacterium]|nr:glycosyltransferase family 4 protein [Alphaproteobacteria bacterium]